MLKIYSLLLFFCSSIMFIHAREYKILVLPSGGATGVISAAMLEHIENETGTSINHLFDEIWCSSVGSVIAGLLSTHSKQSAHEVVEFIEKNFSTLYKSYHLRETIKNELNQETIARTQIPLRILTARAQTIDEKTEWLPFDFSSDGAGKCSDNQLSLVDIIKASCTVYPYLYHHPIKIISNNEKLECIDPGSLCCQTCIVEPTAYFLKQLLDRLENQDSAQIFFLANGFTQSLDYDEVHDVLQKKLEQDEFAIYYHENSFSGQQQKRIEVINIPAIISFDEFFANYLKKASLAIKAMLVGLRLIFDKVVGKENTLPNLLAAGAIPVKELKNKSADIIQNSKNLKAMIALLTLHCK